MRGYPRFFSVTSYVLGGIAEMLLSGFPDKATFGLVGLLAFLYPMTIRNLSWLVAVFSGLRLESLDTATVSFGAGALTLLPIGGLLVLVGMLYRSSQSKSKIPD